MRRAGGFRARAWRGWALIGIAFALIVVAGPAGRAHDPAPPADTPTTAALRTAVVPPRDRVALARQFYGIIAPPARAEPIVYAVGDRRAFYMFDLDAGQIVEREAEVRAIGEHVVLWADARLRERGGSAPDFEALADAFDTRIYPKVRALWGSEALPGWDGDPRVHTLFAYNLGGLTAYYAVVHSYPQAVAEYSNEHEMIFYNLSTVTSSTPLDTLERVIAHEFQHMIRANIKPNTETWLNEGFSMFTEFYMGYDLGIAFVRAFLIRPDTQLNTWGLSDNIMAHYGAGALFVTYFHDRYGMSALRQVSDSDLNALAAFDSVIRAVGTPGETVDHFFADWALANLLHNWVNAESPYRYRLIDSLPAPALRGVVGGYPYTTRQRLPQYSTHYYRLESLSDADTLRLTLVMDEAATLTPADLDAGQVAWYSIRADYSATTLTRAFDLRDAPNSDALTLAYRVWYHLEEGWDYGYVLLSDDGGERWQILVSQSDAMTNDNPYATAYGAGYTGQSGGWLDEVIDLSDYAGREVLIRFAVITDDAVNAPGMLIDAVRLEAVGYASAFDWGNPDGWQAEGWILTDNRLPQNAWVQVAQVMPDGTAVIERALAHGDHTLHVGLIPGAVARYAAVSPFAPLTTVPVAYTLTIEAD